MHTQENPEMRNDSSLAPLKPDTKYWNAENSPQKILYVDDDPLDVAHMERIFFSSHGNLFRLSSAKNLGEASMLLKKEQIDICLLDLSLPDTFRFEGLETIRRDFPNLPVVVVTGSSDSETARQAIRRGAHDFLVKGEFDERSLERVLHYVLERANLERQLREAKIQAERLANNRSEFLSTMSHEIRTPMNGVLGMVNELGRTKLSKNQRLFVNDIKSCAGSLLSVVNEALDTASIEQGKLKICEDPFDLNKILADLKSSLRFFPKAKDVELRIPDLMSPVPLVGDPGRIRQVLLNLLSNALKFTKEGQVCLTVDIDDRAGDTKNVCFRVQDTGPGISEQDQRVIYAPFFQSDAQNDSPVKGTGLGLTITKKMVELMNGEIGMQSTVGAGTLFWIRIPLRVPAAFPSPDSEPARKYDNGRKRLAGKRILVVDDDVINRRVALAVLNRLRCKAQIAEDGEQAVQAVAKESFDLVLMDCSMPNMDGFEATQQIRAHAGKASQVPILAMTAGILSVNQERCLDAGMNGCILKPFQEDQLIHAISLSLTSQAPPTPPQPKEKTASPAPKKFNHGIYVDFAEAENDGGEFFCSLLQTFKENFPERLAHLRKAHELREWKQVTKWAHLLKGNSLQVGADAMAELAAQIEYLAEKEPMDEPLSCLIAELSAEFEPFLKAFEQYRQSQSPKRRKNKPVP